MPNIAVTERKVSPKLDQGLLAGLIAGGVVFVWLFLIGALSSSGAASYPSYLSAIVGTDGLANVGFNGNWLVGSVTHFVLFALIGIVFALVWPRLRKYGTWTPAILFSLAVYVVDFQIIARIVDNEMAKQLNDFGLITGFFLAGVAFAYHYRHA